MVSGFGRKGCDMFIYRRLVTAWCIVKWQDDWVTKWIWYGRRCSDLSQGTVQHSRGRNNENQEKGSG